MTDHTNTSAAWVAVDWGTSHLRLWPMGENGRPLRRIDSDKGMASLAREDYEQTLLALLEPYIESGRTLNVLCCGMVGSRQGWCEAPYLQAPCAPPGFDTATRVETSDPRIQVHVLSGVKQLHPADVMRGEETQIAGVLALSPGLSGVICLPGTHTKWVLVEDGEIRQFSTFLTGELFQLLSASSVLRHTLARDSWNSAAFEAGCRAGSQSPQLLGNLLFGLRAEALLTDLDPVEARSRASGLLLGLEISGMRPLWQGKTTILVGESDIAQAYATALAIENAEARVLDAEQVTLAGLGAARAQMT
jgi:2-dehydro-3-deoxygalactonokinase